MRQEMFAISLSLLFAFDASAARWGPTWSEVTGERWSKVAKDRHGAVIKSIDGRHTTDRKVKLEPGMRKIVVQSISRKGFSGIDRTMELEIKPCKRYYLNAQFANPTTPDWEPVIAKVEDIAGCKLPAPAS